MSTAALTRGTREEGRDALFPGEFKPSIYESDTDICSSDDEEYGVEMGQELSIWNMDFSVLVLVLASFVIFILFIAMLSAALYMGKNPLAFMHFFFRGRPGAGGSGPGP